MFEVFSNQVLKYSHYICTMSFDFRKIDLKNQGDLR